MDNQFLKETIQKVVDREFKSSIERRVVAHYNRINFRCPYCHEGKTKSKKRGNLFLDRLLYVCFRCGKKSSFDRFVKDFNLLLSPDKKLEIINHLKENIKYNDVKDNIYEYKLDKLIDLNEIERVFNDGSTNISDFKPIQDKSYVCKYLQNRGITKNMAINIYEGKYWLSETTYNRVIISLNMRDNKVLGLQIRNLRKGRNRFFKIYNFEMLYKLVNNVDDIEEIDMPEVIIYNKLSAYFNILNIDVTKRITIFEGYLDSLFYPNSIGLVGVNTDLSFLENNGLEIQYFYDNDNAGFEKSEIKLKEGYEVFLWRKLFTELVEKKKPSDPYKFWYRVNKVKDLNKLAELSNNPYKNLNLKEYFSNDIYDIKWIPKKEKKWYKYKK